jgi:hypothetical protein
MPDRLIELLENVIDEQTFLEFVRALLADRIDEVEKERLSPSHPYGSGANGWENGTIEMSLQAAISWADGSHFGRSRIDGKFNGNPWSQFAHFLYAGKIYE